MNFWDLEELMKKHVRLYLKPECWTQNGRQVVKIGYDIDLEDRGMEKFEAEQLLRYDMRKLYEKMRKTMEGFPSYPYTIQLCLTAICFHSKDSPGNEFCQKHALMMAALDEENWDLAADILLANMSGDIAGDIAEHIRSAYKESD